MVNTEDFIKRLEIVLEYYGLNASSFADKIGVQRSSLSHLLSGRNKPSLDFILKIAEVFPDVDLYWILQGKGVFPKNMETTERREFALEEGGKTKNPAPPTGPVVPENLFSEVNESSEVKSEDPTYYGAPKITNNSNSGELEKIVFFFKNGTFRVYGPN